MKRLFFTILLPHAMLAAMLSLAGMYLLGYSWISDGSCTYSHAVLLSILPGLITFIVIIPVGVRAYWLTDRIQNIDRPSIPSKYIFISLVLLTAGIAYSFDYLFFNFCDSSLSQAYAYGMQSVMSTSISIQEDQVKEFANTPFFSQNLAINNVCNASGYLLSWFAAKAILKKPQFA